MATEMVLVPKILYEKLLADDKTYTDKLRYYETLLSNNGIDLGNKKANVTSVISQKETSDNHEPTVHDDTNIDTSTSNNIQNDGSKNDKDVMVLSSMQKTVSILYFPKRLHM
jgi:hypothetical protein